MPQKVTGESEETGRLSAQQLAAVERLLAGDTVTATAEAVGVRRETVHRWQRQDPAFIALLECRRAELRESLRAGLLTVSHRALGNVARAVEGGDLRASLVVLRGAGVLAGASLFDVVTRQEVATYISMLCEIIIRNVKDAEEQGKILAAIEEITPH
jgi:hypothetical protein